MKWCVAGSENEVDIAAPILEVCDIIFIRFAHQSIILAYLNIVGGLLVAVEYPLFVKSLHSFMYFRTILSSRFNATQGYSFKLFAVK